MTTLLLVLSLAAALDGDPLRPGRDALHALDYEKAVAALAPVAGDDDVASNTRARAYVLIAEARFGMAHVDSEARARAALRKALALDPRIDFEQRDDVSPRLLAIFDALRAPAAAGPTASAAFAASASSAASAASAAASTDEAARVLKEREARDGHEERARTSPHDRHADASFTADAHAADDTADDGADGRAVSGWWMASAGLATTAVVAGAVAGGFAYRIYNLPPGLSSDEVRGTQAAGVAALIVAGGAGVAALATSAVALVE